MQHVALLAAEVRPACQHAELTQICRVTARRLKDELETKRIGRSGIRAAAPAWMVMAFANSHNIDLAAVSQQMRAKRDQAALRAADRAMDEG